MDHVTVPEICALIEKLPEHDYAMLMRWLDRRRTLELKAMIQKMQADDELAADIFSYDT